MKIGFTATNVKESSLELSFHEILTTYERAVFQSFIIGGGRKELKIQEDRLFHRKVNQERKSLHWLIGLTLLAQRLIANQQR
jgi:hypothetical protein